MITAIADTGGSGTRFALANNNGLRNIKRLKISCLDEFMDEIESLTGGEKIDNFAMTIPGRVLGEKVLRCGCAEWLEGYPLVAIRERFGLKVDNSHLMHDGDAHALALKSDFDITYPALNLATGSGTGMGILDREGNLYKAPAGTNFGIGPSRTVSCMQFGTCDDRDFVESKKNGDWALYGKKLGKFAALAVLLFGARTLGVSGGVATHRFDDIRPTFDGEFNDTLLTCDFDDVPTPQVIIQSGETGLKGLAALFGDS
jgi:hypothetical protein